MFVSQSRPTRGWRLALLVRSGWLFAAALLALDGMLALTWNQGLPVAGAAVTLVVLLLSLGLVASALGSLKELSRQVGGIGEGDSRLVRLETGHELTLATSGVFDAQVLSQLAIDKAAQALGADGAVLVGRDVDSGMLEVLAAHQGLDRLARPGDGVIGRAMVTRKPVVGQISDGRSGRRGMVSAVLAVPLLLGDRPAGALAVAWRGGRQVGEDQVELLKLLGVSLAPALEAARLHGQQALEEERVRLLHESMACGVIVHEPGGNIQVANQSAIRILGEDIDLITIPTGCRRLVRSDLSPLPAGQHPIMVILRTHQPVRDLVLGLARGSEPIWLLVDAVPVFDSSGELQRIVTSFIDITAHRRVEAVHRENQAKSRFLAVVSHELRTPLNSILGFVQLLASDRVGRLNERQQRYLKHVESSSEHLLALINEVLDLSKIEAGQMEVLIETIDLAPLLSDTLARMAPLAQTNGLELGIICPPGLQVQADRRRLQQVLLNLLSNAIKFTPAGEVKVGAGGTGERVEIWVQDTGTGIAVEQQEKAFQDFVQLDQTSTRRADGTGLGLALSRRLIELMKGEISLESAPGEGSVFTITLPGAPAPATVGVDGKAAALGSRS